MKGSRLVGVIRMNCALMFGSEFTLRFGGRIGNLHDFSFTVFILIGDLEFSADIFGVVV